MKIITIILLIYISMFAKSVMGHNPFKGSKKNGSHQTVELQPLKRVDIKPPKDTKYIEKIVITYRYLDSSAKRQTIYVKKTIDWQKGYMFIEDGSGDRKNKNIEISDLGFVKIKVSRNNVLVLTKKSLISSFYSPLDNKITLMIKDNVDNFLKNVYNLDYGAFKSLEIVNYSGYYKVNIYLKGRYKYYINELKSGVMVEIK